VLEGAEIHLLDELNTCARLLQSEVKNASDLLAEHRLHLMPVAVNNRLQGFEAIFLYLNIITGGKGDQVTSQ